MPDTPMPTAFEPVTAGELQVLLRIAGLTITEDRAPDVLAELNAQLGHARALDRALEGAGESSIAPYDPTFPKITPAEVEGE